ncbi:MAG: TetR/AcrR family transcriptional regulator [Pseudomonadota bacterium]
MPAKATKKNSTNEFVGEPGAIETALENIREAIKLVQPDSSVMGEVGWQKRKSAQTRITLLTATVKCLAKHGYAQTTTQLVANSANISRGAMLHHYATKTELITSTIDYIMYRRMEAYYREISKLSDNQRVEQGHGVEVYWNTILTSDYQAFLELSVASRTDKELRKVFVKKARAFDDLWLEQTPLVFPEWKNQPPERVLLARDLVTSTLEGLHLNHRIMSEGGGRAKAVRAFLSEAIKLIREGS